MGEYNAIYAFIAYSLVWLVFFGYVFFLARRQADVRAEIAELRGQIERSQAQKGGSANPSSAKQTQRG